MTSTTDAPTPANEAALEWRLLGWLIDILIVGLLASVIFVTGLIRISGCEPYDEVTQTFPAACPFANVTEQVTEDGQTELFYVLDNGRHLRADHTTISGVILDAPSKAIYLVPLAYIVAVWGFFQGLTGWTPGRLLSRTRLVGADLRPAGIGRALVRLFIVDGLIGLVGVAIGVAGGPWLAAVILAANIAIGVVGVITLLLQDRRLGDTVAGTFVVPAAALVRPVSETRYAPPERTTPDPVAAERAARAAAGSATTPVASVSGSYADSTTNEAVARVPPDASALVASTTAIEPPHGAAVDSPSTWRPRQDVPADMPAPEPLEAVRQDHDVPLVGLRSASRPAVPAGLDFSPRPDSATETATETASASAPIAAPTPAAAVEPLPTVTIDQTPADAVELPDVEIPAVEAESVGPSASGQPASIGPSAVAIAGETTPEWDPARRAYIFWNGTEWLQYDYARQSWGPISR